MPTTADLIVNPKLKVLVWSKSGTGKTRLAASARPLGPEYIFDFDSRLDGLGALPIEPIDYDTYRDLNPKQPKAFDSARMKLDALAVANPFPYTTVVLDSLTTFQIAALHKSMVQTKAFMPNLKRINDGTAGVEVPVMQDYQGAMAFVEQFLMKLISLPCHVIVTAHEEVDKDPISEKMFWNLAVSGKLAIKLPGLFNELWRMNVTQITKDGKPTSVHQLVTRSDNQYSARTCYPDVVQHFDVPDFAAIYRRIQTFLASKSKAPQLPGK
jgi:hypothetical protein